jgi:uncharacterized membrane protein
MNNMQKTISVAATAALLAISGMGVATPALAGKGAKQVHCYGVNTCKGTSACATAKTSCKGQNECKGQGFIETTAKKCAKMGGSLTEPK